MKIKSLFATLVASLVSFSAVAQSNLTVKGTIDIRYNSRSTPTPAKGVTDTYNMNINVANSALFTGTITDQPQIISGMISKSVTQPRVLSYDVACDVVNPKNTTQTKNVGKMLGKVGIDPDGTYRYDTGTLAVDILPIGNAAGFSSKFGGTVVGKPQGRPAGWLDTLKCNTINITRTVGGKTMTVALKKYDKMDFRQNVIAAGPVASYQPVTVNGEMLYDYDKSCWFFNNVTVQYAENNTIKIDRVSGTIRWVEKTSEYQFDVRVNEPPPGASAAFEASGGTDESAFFETDTTVPALVGKMVYKDTKRGSVTTSSNVTVDLMGNNLSKQQVMSLCKVILFSCVVPMNAD